MSPTSSITANSDTPSKRPPTPAKDLAYRSPSRAKELDYDNRSSSRERSLGRSSISSKRSKRSSIPVNTEPSSLAWNPSHPCYPHPNSHVPRTSEVCTTTRIIRIPRDYMVVGDLAPTYSNTYPEILQPWVSEGDFRQLIKGTNDRAIEAFNPYSMPAWLDLLLGVLTGWFWDDTGFSLVKKKIRGLESFIETWNGQKRYGTQLTEEDRRLVKAIPLRRTGYMSLDIQIPDPKVGLVESSHPSREQSVLENPAE